jgi:hypothetical protein
VKTATQLKFEGLEQAAKHHSIELALAQHIAKLIGTLGKPVSADDVREAFLVREGRKLEIGNAMGSLFAKKDWDFAGFVRSKRVNSHARTLRTWTLKSKEAYKPPIDKFDVQPTVGTENGVRFCTYCGEETMRCTCERAS